jgi:hypothetical protein
MALVVKWLGPLRRSKGPGKLSLPASLTPHTSHQLNQQRIQELYPQCPKQEVFVTPLRVDWHRVVQIFKVDYPRKTRETTLSRFDQGGIIPCLILWGGTCSSWLSPPNSDPGSSQILTQHYSAQSQTVS